MHWYNRVFPRRHILAFSLSAGIVGLGCILHISGRSSADGDGITCLIVSPDGTTAWCASENGSVARWNIQTKKIALSRQAHSGPVYTICMSTDGRILASMGLDKKIKLWSADLIVEPELLTNNSGLAICGAFLVGEPVLVTGGYAKDNMVRIWDTAQKCELHHFHGHNFGVSKIAINPKGQLMATTGGDGSLRIWNVNSRNLILSLLQIHPSVEAICYSPNGLILATAGSNSSLKLWHAGGLLCRDCSLPGFYFKSLTFSPNSAYLFATGGDSPSSPGQLAVVDVATGTELRRLQLGSGIINSLAIISDGSVVITGNDRGTVTFLDVAETFQLSPAQLSR